MKQLGEGQRRGGGVVVVVFTCNNARDHSGHDGGVCARVDPSKDTEQEAVFCHRIDHPRHGEHRAQEAGERNGRSGMSSLQSLFPHSLLLTALLRGYSPSPER